MGDRTKYTGCNDATRSCDFFDVTIDELKGYEPQLSTEQMKKIYIDLCSEFVTKPFEEVMEKSNNLVKRYCIM